MWQDPRLGNSSHDFKWLISMPTPKAGPPQLHISQGQILLQRSHLGRFALKSLAQALQNIPWGKTEVVILGLLISEKYQLCSMGSFIMLDR